MARTNAPASRLPRVRGSRRRFGGGLEDLRQRSALLIARPAFGLALLAGHLLPPSWLLRIAGLASGGAYQLFPGLRANLLSNARHILGEDSPAAPLEHLETYLRGLFNFIGVEPEFVSADGLGISPEQRDTSLKGALIEVERLAA